MSLWGKNDGKTAAGTIATTDDATALAIALG